MKRLIKAILSAVGLEVRRSVSTTDSNKATPRAVGYDREAEAREAISKVRPYTMLPDPRLLTLWQQASHCEEVGIEGAFVECGTWRGGAAALMALANLAHSSRRRHIHLFDSFEGIPEPDEDVDGKRAIEEARAVGMGTGGRLVAPGASYTALVGGEGSLEANREVMEKIVGYDASLLHYHKGWFQNTVPAGVLEIGPVALLRLDGDWYASTKVCLDHLYDLVVPGGFVVIDDYNAYDGCRRAVDEFRMEHRIHDFMHHIDSEGRYWVKG